MAVNSEFLQELPRGDEYLLTGEGFQCLIRGVPDDRRLLLSRIQYEQRAGMVHLQEKVLLLAVAGGMDKITAQVRPGMAPDFFARDFHLEASIPGYFADGESRLLVSRFLSPWRQRVRVNDHNGWIYELSYTRLKSFDPKLGQGYSLDWLRAGEVEAAAEFYSRCLNGFYRPFTGVQDLEKEIEAGSLFAGAHERGKLVAVACLRPDQTAGCGELAYFATAREHQGQGLASHLMRLLLDGATRMGLHCLFCFTSTQCGSMNRILPENGFAFRGRLAADLIRGGQAHDRLVWSRSI